KRPGLPRTMRNGDSQSSDNPARARQSSFVAFTLIELLVVLAVIGLLAAMPFPSVDPAKESRRGTACLSNFRPIGFAIQLYTQENGNRMPFMRDILPEMNNPPDHPLPGPEKVLSNQLGNVKVLRCPSDNKQLYEKTGSSYGWNSSLNGQDADHLN